MGMPNFFIIGAGSSGTTSLYHYLKQHPQVYMSPIKETNFFAYEERGVHVGKGGGSMDEGRFPIRSIEAYGALFEDVSNEKAVGEASPRYLYSSEACRRIHSYNAEAKLVAILRNPVERAYSSYCKHVRDGNERRTFLQAINDEESGRKNQHLGFGQRHYVDFGLYHKYLKRYADFFDFRRPQRQSS